VSNIRGARDKTRGWRMRQCSESVRRWWRHSGRR